MGCIITEGVNERVKEERRGAKGAWMNSCIRAIYSTTGKFPGDKSSGNDKLHCTANSTYLSSNSSLSHPSI